MHRILVVANRTCPCPALLEEVARRAHSRLRHYVSDVDGALAQARVRLDVALAELGEAGIAARGEIGDSDPYIAIDDALARFPAAELVVSTLPPGESNWLERGLIERARRDFGIPVSHLVSTDVLQAAA